MLILSVASLTALDGITVVGEGAEGKGNVPTGDLAITVSLELH